MVFGCRHLVSPLDFCRWFVFFEWGVRLRLHKGAGFRPGIYRRVSRRLLDRGRRFLRAQSGARDSCRIVPVRQRMQARDVIFPKDGRYDDVA